MGSSAFVEDSASAGVFLRGNAGIKPVEIAIILHIAVIAEDKYIMQGNIYDTPYSN
tara:strand:- start:14 stop:181 length:168 start_codon:yes stop_codon:yes gene_type:complete